MENLGVELLIVREGIADEAIPILSKAGITAYRRFERDDIESEKLMTAKTIRFMRDNIPSRY